MPAQVETVGFDILDKRLNELSKLSQRAVIGKTLLTVGQAVAGWARENLRGQDLIDTGALVNSVSVELHRLEAWVFSGLVYAHIQEVGGTIVAKKKYLSIPLTDAAKAAGGASRYGGELHFVPVLGPGGGGGFLVDNAGEYVYRLVRQVTIPARPWLKPAITQHLTEIKRLFEDILRAEIEKIWSGG